MADKIKELEQRVDRIENKLKTTFLEIERRLEQKSENAPMNIDERLQEFEDLILLMQLEITKIREKTDAEPDFGIKVGPDVEERLRKLEESVANEHTTIPVAQPLLKPVLKTESKEVEHELDSLEKRLEKIEQERTETSGVLDDVRRILNA